MHRREVNSGSSLTGSVTPTAASWPPKPDGAPAAARFVAVDREQQARHPVNVDEAARDDSLDALVPTFARYHEHALAMVHFDGFGARNFGKLRLDRAALVVGGLELGGELAGRVEVVGHQQVERDLRIPQPSGGVEPRDDREAEVGGVNGLPRHARLAEQGRQARARRRVHAVQAIGHKRAVLVAHGHEVGDGAQRGKVGVRTPKMRVSEPPAKRLHDLQGHTHSREYGARAVRIGLRVYERNVLRTKVGRLVMVGHHDVDAVGKDGLHLVFARDSAVDGDDELGVEGFDALVGGT